MKYIYTFIILSAFVLVSNAQISVSTIIFDGESQPPIVGGYIDGYNSNVLKKGVIVGLDSTSLIVDTTTTYSTLTFSNITGYWTQSSENIYIDFNN